MPPTGSGDALPVAGSMRFRVRRTRALSRALRMQGTPSPAAEISLRDVVPALPLPEGDGIDARARGEPFQALREAPGHGRHQGRGGHGVATDLPEEPGGARAGPQRRDIGVEIEPVEAFRLQRHVIPECLSGGTCHGHVLDSSRWVPHTAPVAPTKPHGFARRIKPRSGPAPESLNTPMVHLVGLRQSLTRYIPP